MSHASMAGYFLFFYNRYRKEEILKRKEEKENEKKSNRSIADAYNGLLSDRMWRKQK